MHYSTRATLKYCLPLTLLLTQQHTLPRRGGKRSGKERGRRRHHGGYQLGWEHTADTGISA